MSDDRPDVYDLFQRGSALLESGDYSAAAIPLEKASRIEPDKTSIREALGRAYFRSGRYAQASEEFRAVVERAPVNDFAHFCLGRSLEKTGRSAGGPPPPGARLQPASGPRRLPRVPGQARQPAA